MLVDGNSLTVTVPAGGVKEGEVMSVPYPDGWSSPTVRSAPIGTWKVSCAYDVCALYISSLSQLSLNILLSTEWIM